ncbi:hypothetical protein [Azohydromonas lata]|uniref:Uncharacterized protein n=1 Tax=Azohydromonas lata TaxID=45677 RepID=A0ABU5IK44_9BURK|nr:hypothetical protein [Azohydromonas lata]MDZ5459270.1 hypothetical protein [Azohydromonas lata]
MDKVLTERQRVTQRRALDGRLVVLCFGAGVDSTGLMVALCAAGLRPDVGQSFYDDLADDDWPE